MERAVTIPVGDELTLEGAYTPGRRPDVVAIAHPHPQYGGSMDNNVVAAVQRAVTGLGCGAMRFNFRGVGRSGGRYGGGDGEARDVAAALAFAVGLAGGEHPGTEVRGHFAGYSFGAWVALRALAGEGAALPDGVRPASLTLVSPPVDFVPFDGLALPEVPCLIAVGDRDQYCSRATLETWLDTTAERPTRLDRHWLGGVDHFQFGRESTLAEVVRGFYTDLIGDAPTG